MAYAGTADVQRVLWKTTSGSARRIAIGTQDGATISVADANTILDEAQAVVDGMLSLKYAIPPYVGTTSTVHPLVVRWTAMIGAMNIIRTVIQRNPDSEPDPYAAWLEERVEKEWEPYKLGEQLLMGTSGAVVALAGSIYPIPREAHEQADMVFRIKTVNDEDPTVSYEGFTVADPDE